jgi:tetratricopeptide (TPR) repeat protein
MPQPIFVSGRVLLEDGTPPTDSVVIERVCNGQPHSEGYADSKGYFGMELGRQNNGVIRDASENPGTDPFDSPAMKGASPNLASASNTTLGNMAIGSDNRLLGCELRARLVGYRSQSVNLSNRRPLDSPDVGVILLHRLVPNEGGTVSSISLGAPKDAKKAYEKGLEQIKKKKPEDALKSFEKAVETYPKYATAWYELGRLQNAQGDKTTARTSFETAIKSDPKYVAPYLEVASFAVQAANWQEVADLTATATKLNPFDYPQAFFYNAVANYNLKNLEQAEKSARQAEVLDTRHAIPKNSHLLGMILAQRHDYNGAAEKLRNYLKFAPSATDAANVRSTIDQIEKISAEAAPAKQ